jgi:hypothetical protein
MNTYHTLQLILTMNDGKMNEQDNKQHNVKYYQDRGKYEQNNNTSKWR